MFVPKSIKGIVCFIGFEQFEVIMLDRDGWSGAEGLVQWEDLCLPIRRFQVQSPASSRDKYLFFPVYSFTQLSILPRSVI